MPVRRRCGSRPRPSSTRLIVRRTSCFRSCRFRRRSDPVSNTAGMPLPSAGGRGPAQGFCKVSCGFGCLCGKGEIYKGGRKITGILILGARVFRPACRPRVALNTDSGMPTMPIPECNHPQTSQLFRDNLILSDRRARLAGLKTRARSSPLCTDQVSFLFC